ncbi:CDP-diacylglycerol--glycerol-3-phosphate 3-phosphatidyltransferase [Ostreibacterium oceani]|uniref:CDP-diacylglycerol--glycerol-3-phosphate 3-phosphatidyltransferase n=1 Tax=Ostreibacterium oceani TaxID=2654998 RepID=A0A6N7EZD4_9GAMM|nr:CDP-diacylglycerol--glycerol-3-phosphate 3-phosphatidyltransferase [Ostreibacterium oceani]MPV86537.1 CDP-diacylglycerol--glycerol-3-phosphate 3-phosphatidyltransferase [Ostreibacterium oceani]
MNVALQLTFFRVFLVPLYLLAFLWDFPGNHWVAFAIFSLASVTDFFDGYIARRFNQTSKLGALLDPVADKLLIAIVLLSLLLKHSEGMAGLFLLICTAIIIGRDILISALREFMATLNIGDAVAVKYIGKLKTTVQILALGFLIVYKPVWILPNAMIGYVLLGLAAILTVWSMVDYFRAALASLQAKDIDIYK